jgi:uncharacterized protein
MAPAAAAIAVEVIYAEPQHTIVKSFRLSVPATLEDVLRLAARDPDFAGIDIVYSAVGVFGRLAAVGQLLHDGDRVEIYRRLAVDPKSARRARAREARRKT